MSSKALSDLDHGWGRFRAVDVTVGLRLPDREEPVKKETLLAAQRTNLAPSELKVPQVA